jgi:SAM-dependent methyltransferase
MQEFSFSRYLASKRTVDDRALNRRVWLALEQRLAARQSTEPLKVLEVGGGIGTMFQRMIEWGLLEDAEYTLVDEMADNIAAARSQTAAWAARQNFSVQKVDDQIQLTRDSLRYAFRPLQTDMLEFLRQSPGQSWDLLVANAVLDLLDVPAVLPILAKAVKPGGLMYLSINFDGLTALEPSVDAALDDFMIALYHQTMDERVTAGKPSGDSRTGRHLFTWLRQAGLRILEAGSSDWLVYAQAGQYPDDEAYFLGCILRFFEDSLSQRAELAPADLSRWLALRREQVACAELVLIAHQFDFLVTVG